MKRGRVIFLFFAAILLVLFLPLISASTLKVTSEHPFLMNGTWISAKDLEVGDKLVTSNGKTARITRITWHDENVDVFNLEAGIYHNFVLGSGLIVHNSNKIKKVHIPGVGEYDVEFAPYKGVENPKIYTIEQLTDPALPSEIARFKGSPDWGSTGQGALESQITFPNRFSWQNSLVKKLAGQGEIDSFADIGSAVPCYAITTQEVRSILPAGSEVWAVDVLNSPPGGLGGVKFVKQSIVDSSLPRKFKAIRMSHVSAYLSIDDAKIALRNLDNSLEMGGYLLHQDMIYQKTFAGFEEFAVRDTAYPRSFVPFTLGWSPKCNACVVGQGFKIITEIPPGNK